ncbi:hypothetical protein AM374_00680 (plasmid) [Salmonella enterica subsp. enterica serovar Senftenberg]|nr:hypothetical protein AM374_00680 [Salmonella enterica subsp. enterica serovar Senftenberg]
MIWQPEFTDKTLSRKPGAVHDASLSGIAWKAQLIVAHERGRIDSLAVPLDARLIAKNLIDEILAEEN